MGDDNENSIANFVCEEISDANLYKREATKMKILRVVASIDRGVGTARDSIDNERVDELVRSLESMSPTIDATAGLVGGNPTEDGSCPLDGTWKLLYTSAYDVTSLAAQPVFGLEGNFILKVYPPNCSIVSANILHVVKYSTGIFQSLRSDGESRNIIDLAPRAQQLLPFVPPTTFRAVVITRARARSPSRVGLTFRAASIGPQRVLGKDARKLPRLGGSFPDFSLFGANIGAESTASQDGPGYFDVLYLDADFLIIRQNEPGGIFISTRVKPEEYDISI